MIYKDTSLAKSSYGLIVKVLLCKVNFLTKGNNSKILKTFVKTLGPQNTQFCDKTPTEINKPTQGTDMSDNTVENLWDKLSFKALSDDRMSQTRTLSIGIMLCSGVSRKKLL